MRVCLSNHVGSEILKNILKIGSALTTGHPLKVPNPLPFLRWLCNSHRMLDCLQLVLQRFEHVKSFLSRTRTEKQYFGNIALKLLTKLFNSISYYTVDFLHISKFQILPHPVLWSSNVHLVEMNDHIRVEFDLVCSHIFNNRNNLL